MRAVVKKRAKILVLASPGGFRDGIVAGLEGDGYIVALADSLREAMVMLELQSTDFALVDIAVPRVDGLTFLTRLRKRGPHPDLPAIVLTATDATEGLRHARVLGVRACFVKSELEIAELLAAIEQGLRPSAENIPLMEGDLSETSIRQAGSLTDLRQIRTDSHYSVRGGSADRASGPALTLEQVESRLAARGATRQEAVGLLGSIA
ncbi:MAG: response regulator, partial [Bdellovibrionales bacterium]|nr:response regulator [Bdellovibrionales bacterium]